MHKSEFLCHTASCLWFANQSTYNQSGTLQSKSEPETAGRSNTGSDDETDASFALNVNIPLQKHTQPSVMELAHCWHEALALGLCPDPPVTSCVPPFVPNHVSLKARAGKTQRQNPPKLLRVECHNTPYH